MKEDAKLLEQEAEVLRYQQAAAAGLSQKLRGYLAGYADRARDKYGAAVADRLGEWAKTARIEALAEWLGKTGWDSMSNARAQEITAAARAAFRYHHGDDGDRGAGVGRLENGDFLLLTIDPDNPGNPAWAWLGGLRPGGQKKPRVDHDKNGDGFGHVPTEVYESRKKWADKWSKWRNIDTLDGLRAIFMGGNFGLFDYYMMGKPQWLELLASCWATAYAKEAAASLDARARALPLALQSRNLIKAKQTTGAAFLRFPSALRDAGAWAAALVPVDGDTIFAEEPNLAAVPLRVEGGESLQLHKPKAWTIAKGHLINAPLQMVLPGLSLSPKQNRDLGAFLAVSATGAAVLEHLDGTCAKLIPLLFGLCPLDGTPVKGPVKDLVKLLYPDWKARRQMAGDVARVAAAAAAVRDLRAVEVQRDGRLRVYPLLAGGYYDIPTNAEQEPEACFSLNPELGRLAAPAKGAGFMLVNLSGLMRLPANSPERIAVALILAAYWHTCKQRTNAGRLFMPERLDFLPVDDLLVTSNVSGRVAGGIDGTDKSRTTKVRLSEARARMVEETLPALVTAGLVGKLDVKRPGRHGGRAGKAWIVKVDPPADYLEASRKTGRARRKPTAAGRAAPRKGG